jgi:hypothetical protein
MPSQYRMSMCLELAYQKVRRDKPRDEAASVQRITVETARLRACQIIACQPNRPTLRHARLLVSLASAFAVIAASPHLLLERALSQELDVSCATARFDFSSLLYLFPLRPLHTGPR